MRALVVGGKGLMGRWFGSYLQSEGYEVATVDPRGPVKGFASAPTIAAGLQGLGPRDVVLVATPMDQAAGALGEVRAAGTRAFLADICSIKAPVAQELRALARAGFKVASLHPMWGPDAVLLSDKNLLVVDCGVPAATRHAKALFQATAVRVRRVRLEEHDRLMGWALGLPHLVNLAFSLALARSGHAAEDLEPLGGPTMRAQLAAARNVARENKDLYHGIQAFNPETPAVHEAVQRALQELHDALRDKERFKALMAACEAYYEAEASPPRARRKGFP